MEIDTIAYLELEVAATEAEQTDSSAVGNSWNTEAWEEIFQTTEEVEDEE